MTDIQLQRDTFGYLPYLTHWAPHEPAIKKSHAGNSDHWAKMKHKVASLSIQDSSGKNRVFHTDRMRHERPPEKGSFDNVIRFQHEIDGTLTRIGGSNFSDIIVRELHGKLPGDYTKPRPLPPKLLRTAANARAREGHKYWYMEKTFKKDPGKYTMGSAKTFLGIGK
ncbi:uncharacterized protein LOC110243968 [Exaiptasia diaphana]|uniref:Uncharacterized protein n=1 Tax=Exaiptasia diaphana TaxID=2652724 RepID=A0A913XKD3_EXADI|nr:uncharacterized protein LOC110243968 [Exaiptasia diaphana]KXJ20245.1 hypothetical protein AC249_AIPGENE16619 [Exaiptasia diaphana]